MRILRDENGQALVLTALCGSVLLGFMALALDVGVLYHQKRGLQTAADAAALAGALDYLYTQNTDHAKTTACAAATKNGFSGTCSTGSCNDGTSTKICVNSAPVYGPNAGTSTGTFWEAIVEKPTPTIFHGGSSPVIARAVAGTPTNGQACIWLMRTSGNALDVQGSYDIEAPDCGIYVNSNTSDAMSVTGNSGTINTPFVDVVGNSSLQHIPNGVTPTMNSGVRKSPWGNINGPTNSDCQAGNTVTGNAISSSTTIPSPINGVVCFSGSSPKISGTMTFPGSTSGTVYYFQNGVTINTGANVTFGSGSYNVNTKTFSNTSGAMLDIGSGTFSQGSNSVLNIYSPTSGSYDGIALFQPASNTNLLKVQFGSNNQVLDGYIYALGAEVFMQDSGGGVTATGLVAAGLYDKTTAFTVPSSYDKANPSTTLNRVLSLVE
jgi:Flp pilus assembly protein TadG